MSCNRAHRKCDSKLIGDSDMTGNGVHLRSLSAIDDSLLLLDIINQVAVLTINRPEKRNCLTLEPGRSIGRAVTELDGRDDVRVIVLTGAGTSFCAGADISEFAQVRSNPQQVEDYELSVDACCDAIAACSKPTIAGINGFVLAAV